MSFSVSGPKSQIFAVTLTLTSVDLRSMNSIRTKFNVFTLLFTLSINVNSKINKNSSDSSFLTNKARKQIAVNVRALSMFYEHFSRNFSFTSADLIYFFSSPSSSGL